MPNLDCDPLWPQTPRRWHHRCCQSIRSDVSVRRKLRHMRIVRIGPLDFLSQRETREYSRDPYSNPGTEMTEKTIMNAQNDGYGIGRRKSIQSVFNAFNLLNLFDCSGVSLALLCLVIFSPTAVHALGTRIPNQDAESTAKGPGTGPRSPERGRRQAQGRPGPDAGQAR